MPINVKTEKRYVTLQMADFFKLLETLRMHIWLLIKVIIVIEFLKCITLPLRKIF